MSSLRFRRRRLRPGDAPAGKVYDRFEVGVEVAIRLAVEADIAHLETWQGFDTPAHHRALRYYLAMQDAGAGAFIVAETGGYPVAQLFLWFHRDDPSLADGSKTVSITALRVRPAFRRRGIATRMARVAEQLAEEIGFDTVTIGTDVDNHPAHRLYLSWGYEEFKRDTYEWDGETHPQICLRKRLPSPCARPAAPPAGGTDR